MKVVFAGPSIYPSQSAKTAFPGVDRWLGPARQGDIAQAVQDGATSIGLIDGLYGTVAAVWHKEILYALAAGVQIFGGASLGALRAAECARFGMVGVGDIFKRYASGELEDDGAVALLHAPAELDHMPLTEPLVDIEAKISSLVSLGQITSDCSDQLLRASRSIFFWNRSVDQIIYSAELDTEAASKARTLIVSCKARAKYDDAMKVLARLQSASLFDASFRLWKPEKTRSLRLVSTPRGVDPASFAQGSLFKDIDCF